MHQFLGTFGNAGNGDYRGELRRAIQVITSYAAKLGVPPTSVLVRLDGLYGDAAPLLDVLAAHLSVIVRSRAYHLLESCGSPANTCPFPRPDEYPRGKQHDAHALRLCVCPLNANGTRGAPGDRDPSSSRCCSRRGRRARRHGLRTLCQHAAHAARSPLRMCLISTYTVARLRPCWLTRTRSKRWIVGTRIPAFRQEFAQVLAQWMWNFR